MKTGLLSASSAVEFVPDSPERAREILRTLRNPARHRVRREPVAAFDLFRIQCERTLRFAAVNPDEILVGVRSRGELEKFFQRRRRAQPDLLAQLADRAGVVVLAAIQMSRRRRVPQ